jgi:hypothetical protein
VQLFARRFGCRMATVLGLLAFAASVQVSTAHAARSIPVGMYNVNNQVMNSGQYTYAIRFVLDSDTTLYRFFSGFNLEGSDAVGGRDGYSKGSGGVIYARLVNVKADGTPDLSSVLSSERVSATQRYAESKTAYNVPGLTQLLYFNMGGIPLKANTPYAMVYTNIAGNPSGDFFSENSPTVKESAAGPNGVNTLDANAPNAIAGLDPREAVAWSTNGGSSWVWGRRVGEGNTPGAYSGSSSDDDGTRLPWYGWQTSASAKPQSNQPFYAYTETGSYTLKASAVPKAVTLTEAGGYAPVGEEVGVVTVRNTTTGAVGHTASLGSGLAKGALDNPVPVAAGQGYEISNTGTVSKQEADSFIQSTFGVGKGGWPFQTVGDGADMAELFALPYPYFASVTSSAPAPPPVAQTASHNGAPVITLTAPKKGSYFRDQLTVSADAGDDHGVARVELWIDGKLVGQDTATPWSFTWKAPKGFGGWEKSHRIVVKAYDGEGLTATDSVNVTRTKRARALTARKLRRAHMVRVLRRVRAHCVDNAAEHHFSATGRARSRASCLRRASHRHPGKAARSLRRAARKQSRLARHLTKVRKHRRHHAAHG